MKRVEELVKRNRMLEKEIEKLKKETLSTGSDDIMSGAVEVNGVKIISRVLDGRSADEMRELSDAIRGKEQNAVVLFGSAVDGKALLMFAATNNAVKKGVDCGKLIKDVAPRVGGGGGGRKDMAQAGGKNPDGLGEAVKQAASIARGMIK